MLVYPAKWDAFSAQIVEPIKFSFGDDADAWATGILSFSIFPHTCHIGRIQTHCLQEKLVKTGLGDALDGTLGNVLQTWKNGGYFHDRGLVTSLELSEAAMGSPDQQSSFSAGDAHRNPKRGFQPPFNDVRSAELSLLSQGRKGRQRNSRRFARMSCFVSLIGDGKC